MNKYIIQFIAVLSAVFITVGFGLVFFQNRSFGAFGDDSPGYIYQATKFIHGETHIEKNALAEAAFTYFDDPEVVRFVIPHHSKPLNKQGVIASKYPIGAGLFMAGLAKIGGSEEAFYLMTPICASGVIFLLFWMAYLAVERWSKPFQLAAASLSALLIGVSPIYYEYAISQPMRELPSMVFILLSFIFLLYAKRSKKGFWPLLIAAGAAFGISLNIRHTGVVLAPAFFLVFFYAFPKKKLRIKPFLSACVVFGVAVFLCLIPSILNSYNISKNSVSFDTGGDQVVIASNIDHVESLSFSNIFQNNGRFRSGKGSLPHFLLIISQMSTIPLFLLAMAVGVFVYVRKQTSLGLAFAYAAMAVVGFFSLWVNPYSRYILPAYPFLILFISIGIVTVFSYVMRLGRTNSSRLLAGMAATAALIMIFLPHVEQIYLDWKEPPVINKSLTREDFERVLSFQDLITDPNPMIVLTGNYMYGLGEMIQGHSGVPSIRIDEKRVEEDEAITFIEKEVIPKYATYFWNDPTTSGEVRDMVFERWDMERIHVISFSFVPIVEIYRVNGLLE